MNETYTNTKDYQSGSFALGRTLTIEGWREQGIEWANMDEWDGIVEELEQLPQDQVIDYINEFWQIEIVKTSLIDKDELKELQEWERL